MKRHTIRLMPLGKELLVNDQTPLIDVLNEFGIEFPCGGRGVCGKCKVRLLQGDMEVTVTHRRKLEKLGLSSGWRLACFSRCTSDITLEIEQFEQIILADESRFDFIPKSGYGVAVDLGTTTIVAQLMDLSTSAVVEAETMLNPQLRFGSDLISRIQACLDGHAGEMGRIIRQAIGDLIEKMLIKHAVKINEVVMVGNTVMQHIFSFSDVSPLSVYPFQAVDTGMKTFTSAELDWNFQVSGSIRFFPSIGSFVGSDVLAGIAATGLYRKDNITALIDLGTNGEIVMGNSERIVCASTAAGPAFEGSNISMGMLAVTGAISSLKLAGEKMVARVIGNTSPRGICGSALIDAVALLRKLNRIGSFGEIMSGEDRTRLVDHINLTQRDINEFQLAKAALAAGMVILADTLSIQLSDLQEIYVAGGFGNFINLQHVTETGMIEFPHEKIHKKGNTALIGAKMFLLSDQVNADEILSKASHISLEAHPRFQDIFVEKMLIP